MATRSRATIAALMAGPASLAVAGALANGINLVMNLVVARVLDPTAYGAVVVQISIFMVLAVVGNALLIAVVHKEAAAEGDSRRDQWSWIRRLRNQCLVGVVATAAVASLLCRPVAALLSYAYPLALAEAVIAAAVWTMLCVERGVLQARGAYSRLAVNLAVEAFTRVSLVILFVVAGFGVTGAGLGLVLGTALAAEHARRGLAKVPRALPVGGRAAEAALATTGPLPIPQPEATRKTGLLASTGVALAALVPLALLQNMDVVIVGWLDHDGAGHYAAIATACKVPVFIGLAVANFLLPEAARRRAQGHGAGAALAVAVALVVTPGLALAGLGLVAAKPLISLIFGPDLVAASSSLPILALGMTCLAITLMFATYLLGAAQRRVVVVLATCTVLSAAAIGAADGDPRRTAIAVLVSQAVTAFALGVVVHLLHRADARARTSAAGTSAAGTSAAGTPTAGTSAAGAFPTGTSTAGTSGSAEGPTTASAVATPAVIVAPASARAATPGPTAGPGAPRDGSALPGTGVDARHGPVPPPAAGNGDTRPASAW